MKVYIVMARMEYEGSDVARVFASKDAADAFVKRCDAHRVKKFDIPSPPPIEDTPENDKAHQEWFAKIKRWEKRHPAPNFSGYDGFDVVEQRVWP